MATITISGDDLERLELFLLRELAKDARVLHEGYDHFELTGTEVDEQMQQAKMNVIGLLNLLETLQKVSP